MSALEVKVPDIGDFKDVPVIEVLVKPGDRVAPEDSLVTLESDKATMDVPSPASGRVRELSVKAGDKVSEGSVILALETSARAGPKPEAREAAPAPQAQAAAPTPSTSQPEQPAPAATTSAAPPPEVPPASR